MATFRLVLFPLIIISLVLGSTTYDNCDEHDAVDADSAAFLQVRMSSSPPQKLRDTLPAKLLFVGVMSGPRNRQRRDAVRSSYLNALRKKHTDGHISAKFIIGHTPFTSASQGTLGTPQQLQLERDLEEEAEAHGDIQRIALPEKYENLPDKVLLFLQQGVQQQYKFLMKVDDDQVLAVDATERFVALHSPDELLYAGSIPWRQGAYKSQKGADGDFVPYFGGPCYLLSQGLAHQIVEVHGAHTAEFTSYGSSSEDVDMGRWVQWESALGGNVTFKDFPAFVVPR